VRQALGHLGIDERAAADIGIRVLKLGMTWPLEPQRSHAFALGLEEIVVVEEKRPLVEDQIKTLLYAWPTRAGRASSASAPTIGSERMAAAAVGRAQRRAGRAGDRGAAQALPRDTRIDERAAWLRAKDEALSKPSLSPQLRGYLSDAGRVPYFCSGCPHNTSTRVPEGSEAIAGVGCHFMATYIFSGTKIFSPMGSEGRRGSATRRSPTRSTSSPTWATARTTTRACCRSARRSRRTPTSRSRSSTTTRRPRPAASRCLRRSTCPA
jgi:indolepyruvate ferredoxin oxidoreductase